MYILEGASKLAQNLSPLVNQPLVTFPNRKNYQLPIPLPQMIRCVLHRYFASIKEAMGERPPVKSKCGAYDDEVRNSYWGCGP